MNTEYMELLETVDTHIYQMRGITALLVGLTGGELPQDKQPKIDHLVTFLVDASADIHDAAEAITPFLEEGHLLSPAVLQCWSILNAWEVLITEGGGHNPFGMHKTDALLSSVENCLQRIGANVDQLRRMHMILTADNSASATLGPDPAAASVKRISTRIKQAVPA